MSVRRKVCSSEHDSNCSEVETFKVKKFNPSEVHNDIKVFKIKTIDKFKDVCKKFVENRRTDGAVLYCAFDIGGSEEFDNFMNETLQACKDKTMNVFRD